MGFIKTIITPTTTLAIDMTKLEGPKVVEASIQTSLVNLIDMLTVISSRAHEVFSGVLVETTNTVKRLDNLTGRVTVLHNNLPHIDHFFQGKDFESLSHNARAGYHVKGVASSRMLTPQSRPLALQEVYEGCRKPPSFETLDPLNDPPGTSCLKLYSDPGFFEAEWIIEMEKQRQVAKVKRQERKKKRAEAPKNQAVVATNKVEAKPVMRARYDKHTGQRIDVPSNNTSSSNLLSSSTSSSNILAASNSSSNLLVGTNPSPPTTPHHHQSVERGNSVPAFTPAVSPRSAPNPTGSLTHGQARSIATGRNGSTSASTPQLVSPRAIPPTPQPRAMPPTPGQHQPPPPAIHHPQQQPQQQQQQHHPHHLQPPSPSHPHPPPPSLSVPLPPSPAYPPSVSRPPPAAPAPPPPPAPAPPPPSAPAPPPPSAPAPPPPPPAGGSSLASALAAKGGALRTADEVKAKPVDAQSDLLNQIKKGMNLKQTIVEEHQKQPPQAVAAILARRIAIADSDDESDAESDEWSD